MISSDVIGNINSAEFEIDPLMFFNVPLCKFLNEIQKKAFVKKNIPRALILTFSPLIWRQKPFLN